MDERTLRVGDLVSRARGDLHRVERLTDDSMFGDFLCVRADLDGIYKVGTVEHNKADRYTLVHRQTAPTLAERAAALREMAAEGDGAYDAFTLDAAADAIEQAAEVLRKAETWRDAQMALVKFDREWTERPGRLDTDALKTELRGLMDVKEAAEDELLAALIGAKVGT